MDNHSLQLRFLGANGTVTGSRYLLEFDGRRVLVDCGLFQGYKALRLKNWAPLPVEPASIDAILLTHAHLDHSGYLPRLAAQGFRGPVYCTEATRRLCGVMLPDSGRLLEEEAEYANRKGTSRHKPALPPASAHADADELMAWMRSAPRPPQRVFVTHGEADAADALRARIERELGWPALVPEYGEQVQLA